MPCRLRVAILKQWLAVQSAMHSVKPGNMRIVTMDANVFMDPTNTYCGPARLQMLETVLCSHGHVIAMVVALNAAVVIVSAIAMIATCLMCQSALQCDTCQQEIHGSVWTKSKSKVSFLYTPNPKEEDMVEKGYYSVQ